MMHQTLTNANTRDTSPRTMARLAGALYLLMIILAGIGTKAQDTLVNPADAGVTAINILGNLMLLHGGFTAYLVEMACNVAVTVIMLDLLKPVSATVSRLAAFFSLVAIIVKTFSRLFLITPAYLLGGSSGLHGFTDAQLKALSMVFLHLNAEGAGLAMAFFGFSTVLTGYLTYRSVFLPQALGVLGILAGLGWLTFLWLPFGLQYVGYISAIAFVGVAVKIGWLLIVGVNEESWRAAASRAQASLWR